LAGVQLVCEIRYSVPHNFSWIVNMICICDTATFRSGRLDGIEGDERKSFKVFFISEKSERGPGRRTNENAPSIEALVPKLRRQL
jgi:hypothetical protein